MKKDDQNRPLTKEEEQAISYSYFKGSRKGFHSWIIPLGALPVNSLYRNRDRERRSKKA